MKVELKIEGPGIQVYCYELNAERKKELEENFNKMVMIPEVWKMDNPGKEWTPPIYPMDMVEEYCENGVPILITHGMIPPYHGLHHDGSHMTVSLSVDGKDKEFAGVCAVAEVCEDDFINEFVNPDLEFDLNGESPDEKPTNFDECILHIGNVEHLFEGLEKERAEAPHNHLLVYRIISYTNGCLTASFEVDDDFKPSQLALLDECPDSLGIEWIYYDNIFDCLRDRYQDSIGFDENTLRGVLYKGQLYDFELSFKGGDRFVAALENDSEYEGGWDHAYLHESWGDYRQVSPYYDSWKDS